MKKFYVVLVFFAGLMSQAQVITFADPQFKAALLQLADINEDNEIDQDEAAACPYLALSGSITDISGLEYFVNITDFIFLSAALSSIDLPALPQLQHVSLSCASLIDADFTNLTGVKEIMVNGPLLSNINLAGLTALETLSLDYCNFSEIDLSGLTSLKEITIQHNQLQTIDFSQVPNLQSIRISYNAINVLDVSSLVNLEFLWASNCPNLATIDVSNCTALEEFLAYENLELSSVDFSGCHQLYNVQVNSCQLTSLDLSENPNLTLVSAGDNLLDEVNLSGSGNVYTLEVAYNNLAELDLSHFPNLHNVNVGGNQLTTIDVSDSSSLTEMNLSGNPWETIFMKNGSNEQSFGFSYTSPGPVFICADDSQLDLIQGYLNSSSYTDVLLSSYCSFTPGGNYNTIAGTTIFDATSDGCDTFDGNFANLKINVSNVSSAQSIFTQNDGNFQFYTNTGTFTLMPQFENPVYFNASPATVIFPSQNGTLSTQDFCITPNGNHADIEVTLHSGIIEPGFDTTYYLFIKNKGNQTVSGTAQVSFDDSRLDFISATPSVASQNGTALSWTYANLQPFGTRSYSFVVNVNSPTETPAVNIGDTFSFVASAEIANDETPLDNTFTLHQTVLGSFDPNDKTCLEGEIVSAEKIGEYLHYMIRFENTGTANAHNIVVKDMIDVTQFDVATLQFLTASHEADVRIAGNKVEFIFEGIELEPLGQGFVLFKIRTLPTIAVNSTVSNKADIFFDYNFPIVTNDAETTFQLLSVGETKIDTSITIFPNPTKSDFSIKANTPIQSVEMYDVQGRLLSVKKFDALEVYVSLGGNARGVYFVKVVSDDGSAIQKIVKS